ncbi:MULTISPECIES: NAD(P)-dependent alcohol dehydrogenase [Flavobacterium]|uniref:NAD(P)-dependent alcohol dehydrogenase n=1 Tax=Flavobacterium ranwuense TaxID=2541725 RepID=A0ABY2DU05_9FLAO|nr:MULTISPECIES: NAD(P)-dependent alcohol dehydrogenase [Flavobacterium]TDE31192.1 NAD(P)-dependent alcohol dehydrogenase [Flavobacterium ranwuense]TDE55510.1 NAD(P)-dependent alcohol dehydrogenase [Flavobacterium sp. GT3P67]
MTAIKAYAAYDAETPLKPYSFDRKELGKKQVQIEILYSGVCHSDIHTAKGDWGPAIYPLVPGHEIVGRITAVGSEVSKFKVGELAGVGCFVDSCRTCPSCKSGEEQYCEEGMTGTYNSYERGTKTPTYGGYSTSITVDESYTLHISDKLELSGVAPLLCAGITTYSPLRYLKVGKGHKVGVLGLGGLGHMAVKFAVSFGAEVTMLSHSPSKEADAKKLGAHHFALTSDSGMMDSLTNKFDFILNTVSAKHDYNAYLNLLNTNGTMIIVGVPTAPAEIPAITLIMKRRKIMGSLIGGIAETQEMLDYCAANNITSDVEVIDMGYINEAYERMNKSDVKYRFVIDMASLK